MSAVVTCPECGGRNLVDPRRAPCLYNLHDDRNTWMFITSVIKAVTGIVILVIRRRFASQ